MIEPGLIRHLGLALFACAVLMACAHRPGDRQPAPPYTGPVDLVVAAEPPKPSLMLDIGVRVFDQRRAEDSSTPINETVFNRIRNLETHYLPIVLRDTLIASNHWGAVRVLPQDDPSVDLRIQGTIVESDGATLELEIVAVDSSGREWLERSYRGNAYSIHYPDLIATMDQPAAEDLPDPFGDVYARIANDLLAARLALSKEELAALRKVSALVHARDLSPDAFAAMLAEDDAGHLALARLPAVNDPMLARVERMRERHHIFIDTIDAYYDALYWDTKQLYDLWRHYSHDHVSEEIAAAQRPARRPSGEMSFESLRRNYERYRWAKIFEQEFVGLATGFVHETAPAVLELSQRVNGLTGSVDEQYDQWRVLLRELFELETGGVLNQPVSAAGEG